MKKDIKYEKIYGAIMGAILGDSMGVKYELIDNNNFKNPKLKEPGYWSDDTSMILCTMHSFLESNGFDKEDMGDMFLKWLDSGFWTPQGIVLDCGRTTALALSKIRKNKDYSGLSEDIYCGNGSLMRIIPILFYIEKNYKNRFQIIKEISSITHSNDKCIISCCVYLEFALNLLKGMKKKDAYKNMQESILKEYKDNDKIKDFEKILSNNIWEYKKEQLKSSGYVISTLETSLWCFFHSRTYKKSVKLAISFGGDTDTIACVTGGLSGLVYGYRKIPKRWVKKLVRINDIYELVYDYAEYILSI